MIATLSGTITEKLPSMVVISVGGIGYGLLVPIDTNSRLSIDEEAKLYIYEHIRENSYDLYGFDLLDFKEPVRAAY